ncbi:DNA-directed DNA polymerase alpha catalytic subunit pol1 [Blastocladiella emersonii ATCC 22665]|nr:DNA-directed DNA polymerase alpha catalytic subunit pol1 [Blastocladiella emersonii ATCC 22665]
MRGDSGAAEDCGITLMPAMVKTEDGKPVQSPAAPSSLGSNATASRARHSNVLVCDPSLPSNLEWRLGQRVLPPVTRLYAVIERTNPARLAHLPWDCAHFGAAQDARSGDATNDMHPPKDMLLGAEWFAAVEQMHIRYKNSACTALVDLTS